MPQRVDITLVERRDPPSGRIFLFESKEDVSTRRVLLEAKEGEGITFGQIFDAATKEKEIWTEMRIDRLVLGWIRRVVRILGGRGGISRTFLRCGGGGRACWRVRKVFVGTTIGTVNEVRWR